MLIADFLATLPPVADDAPTVDREARRRGIPRDPFGTREARDLASKLVTQYETTEGPQDLAAVEWPAFVRSLRSFSDSEWAALQRKRAAPTSDTSPEVIEEDPRPARSTRKKTRAE
jgi:hypothetical protein